MPRPLKFHFDCCPIALQLIVLDLEIGLRALEVKLKRFVIALAVAAL
jgi:hypothetical protein